ncbi:MAG: YggS family pyridoxal phosphate-dependent enzyme [Puniceicoccales bacterium]|jgi:pyridoxal phosphate enzyme (YggS family)|nr:YggS family pyridoxal phosphate-dependent enzyme [Puniceicoccales bacterium]
MTNQADFLKNLAIVRERINAACVASGRDPASVTLLPVTKTHPPEAAAVAYAAGLGAVGENRVQEAAAKRPLSPAGLRWELVGHLQGNKATLAATVFDRVQSLDSPQLAVRLARSLAAVGKVMPVLLQANTGGDTAKFGVANFDALLHLCDEAFSSQWLNVEGVMTVPPLESTTGNGASRRAFARLREWRDALETRFGRALPILSMGMSGDIEDAVAEGSTLVRVGTALFGTR